MSLEMILSPEELKFFFDVDLSLLKDKSKFNIKYHKLNMIFADLLDE